MRRVLWVLGFIGVGVLAGFLVRLIVPRVDAPVVYVPPATDEVSAERRNA